MTRARDVANLIGSGNYSSTTFTATAGQTAFTISHTQGFIQVFMNGLLLDETADYTSNGSAVTLTSGAAAGDEIEVVAYNTFSVGDALNQAAADTRYVNATGDTVTGQLTVDTATSANLNVDSGVYGGIQFKVNGTNTGYVTSYTDGSGNEAMYIGGADTVNLHTGTNHALTGGSTRLGIDATGRVTTPNQPMFDAYLSGNYTTSSSGVYNLSTLANWATRTNIGGHFVNNTGTFTAPVAGKYLFVAGLGVQSYPTSSYLSCEFEVNGARRYIHWFQNYGTSYSAANNSAIINLSANDYVRVVTETHVIGTYIGHSSGLYSHFGGMLLG